jgi:hypothetical protein
MITRDIALDDSILDLIDNCVDGAWKVLGGIPISLDDNQDLSRFEIGITASEDAFEIVDNCGGISLDDAIDYAFTFGRRSDDNAEKFSIGVYGIGMKRAVFKIGNDVSITSTYPSGAKVESFKAVINVPLWLGIEPWDFELETTSDLSSPGVSIKVTDLLEDTRASFGSPAFVQKLRRTISRDYALHLARGLNILVNGQQVTGWQIEMLASDQFAPLRTEYVEQQPGGEVKVEFLVGMAAPPPENPDPESQQKLEDRNGWYVVCNGRIVVAADKTSITGWGTDDWPQWHPQYAGFLGIVMFTSENAVLLPLTTTKRSIDTSSGVFRRARNKMKDATRVWIDYTNIRKASLDVAKAAEAAAQPVPIKNVPKRETVNLPVLVEKKGEPVSTISYWIERGRIQNLARAFGNINLSYREVGRRSFEHSYTELVGKD